LIHVKQRPARREHHAGLSMEAGVTTNEFYYLLLVIGAFGAFAVGMSLATLQDLAWRRREQAVPIATSRAPARDVRRLAA
jgi:hypothetical protein